MMSPFVLRGEDMACGLRRMMMMKILLRAGQGGRWQEAATNKRLCLAKLIYIFSLYSRPELRNTLMTSTLGITPLFWQ